VNRRPNARDGVVVPRFTAVMVLLLAAGVAMVAAERSPLTVEVGCWLAAGGAVGVVTAGLLFWRVGPGGLIALPLWLGYAGALAVRVGAPAGVGGLLIAAGVLVVVSLLLVSVNRSIGSGLALSAWLIYAGLLLRVIPDRLAAHGWWLPILSAGVTAVVATVARVLLSRSSSRGLLRRLGRAGRETDGLASSFDVWRAASARVLRKNTTQVRPSYADKSWWQRRRVALTELGARIARIGLVWLWSSIENHTITFGGPRQGKTQHVVNFVLDAPGAVITTSTKQDILRLTTRRRGRKGPLWVFDPSGLTEDGSTIGFDPLDGCTDAAVAMDRAADLIDGIGRSKSDGQGERWDGFAKQTLQSLMHAAALGGYSMFDVQQWVAHPTEEAARDVLYELRIVGATAAGMEQEAKQFFGNNPNTQSSISTSIMPALSWLSVPSAAASALRGGPQFDVQRLLDETGTVYLIGAEDKKTAPLVTALTAHIARQARRLAAGMPRERLDPPLTMVLDEAALICLIPLDQWSGDFGSRGITMHIVAQSRAQMRQRFGDAATGSLLTNCRTKVLFGGTGDDDDLRYWSTLAGEREEPAITRDRSTGSRSVSTRKTPVLTPGQVQELRTGQILVISNGMPPAITKARMAYKRWDVRAARFHNRPVMQATARLQAAVEDRVGGWLLGQTEWLRSQATAGLDRIERLTRGRLSIPATRGLGSALAWLDSNDPAREVIARVRLIGAMRRARAALGVRTDRAARKADRPTGGAR